MAMPRPQDPIDRLWAKKAEDLQLNSLERIKSTSEKWLGTISSLTGVFGIVALIKGPSDISQLSSGLRFFVVGMVILAVISTFLSIILAALAAQGVPKKMWATGSVIRDVYTQEADKALFRLNWSRFLVIPAVIALGLAIISTWIGTWSTLSEPTNYVVIYKNGDVVCGHLASNKNKLILVGNNGPKILKNIKSIDIIKHCP